MTTAEHLFTTLAEEFLESAHRVCKILRFGLLEIQPGQTYTNQMRLLQEMADMMGTLEFMSDAGIFTPEDVASEAAMEEMVVKKKAKLQEMLDYARALGTVTD